MNKNDLELFKRAISEGLSERLDSVVNSYTDEIVCSEKHNFAMRTIVYGKVETKRTCKPRKKLIIAIIVAAALLLTSCGIIFRNEIREIIDDFFTSITFRGDKLYDDAIDEVYDLTYLPDAYAIEEESIVTLCAQYKFVDNSKNVIKFEQRILNGSNFVVDIESGYSKILETEDYDIYYRYTDTYHCYIWNDGKYSFRLNSSIKLSNEDIVLMLDGIAIKQ